MNSSENQNTIFPKGERAPADYFTGVVWFKNLVPADEILNTQIGNVVFEPGARNNWHTHPGGQILIATAGVGYYQEKGKPIQILHPGDIVKISPGIVHWHGASPDMHLPILLSIAIHKMESFNGWDKVTDEEYMSLVSG